MVEAKLAGAGLVVLSASAMGFAAGRDMLRRIQLLTEFKKGLVLLSQEIRLRKATMQEAALSVSVLLEEPWKTFFHTLAGELEELPGRTFSQIWRGWAEKMMKDLPLNGQERDLIYQVGRELGTPEAAGYGDLLLLHQQRLEELILKAREEYTVKAGLYSRLGMIGGIFMVILMI